MSTRAAAGAALDEFDRVCGLKHLKVVHVNDSKAALGSRRDLHAHIGEGTIGKPRLGASGFAAVVNRPELRGVPKILETPKGTNPAGSSYDILNVRRLKRLIKAAGKPIMRGRGPRPRASRPSYTGTP
jgi:deoxyribonuclease-4